MSTADPASTAESATCSAFAESTCGRRWLITSPRAIRSSRAARRPFSTLKTAERSTVPLDHPIPKAFHITPMGIRAEASPICNAFNVLAYQRRRSSVSSEAPAATRPLDTLVSSFYFRTPRFRSMEGETLKSLLHDGCFLLSVAKILLVGGWSRFRSSKTAKQLFTCEVETGACVALNKLLLTD